MSQDLRNSLEVTVQVCFFALVSWLGAAMLRGVDIPSWVTPVGGIIALINFVVFARGLWLRRASNPDNPNHV